jgi:hypothetical protein
MDATQLAALNSEIGAAVDTASSVAEVIAPQYAAFIILGQALAKAMPGLVEDVQRLLSAQEPTDADIAALGDKIAALASPETL